MKTRQTSLSTLITAVALLAISAPSYAAPDVNLIQNGDFANITGTTENGFCYMNGATCQASNWQGSEPYADGGSVVIGANNYDWGTPGSLDSTQLSAPYEATGYLAGIQALGQIGQTLTLSAGTYKLSWIDANRGQSVYGDQSYAVSFNGLQLGNTFDTVRGGGWQEHALSFKVDTGTTAALSFKGLKTNDATAFIDNVKLVQTSAVPEPESVALVLAGLAVVGQLGRRRRA